MEKESQLQICDSLINEVKNNSRILHCYRFDQSSSIWIKTYHDHDYLELLYFIKGQAQIEGDHSRTLLATNDLIIYPPGFGHKESVDFTKHQEAVCLGLALRPDFTFAEALTISDPDHQLEWLFTQLHLKYQRKNSDITDQLRHLLFYYIKECCKNDNSDQQPISVRVINYFEHHYREKIYQQELSDLVNVSSTYMYKIFKQETGQTPMDYLNRLRISKALDLLSRRNLTLEEIGSQVGIHDPKYFSKLFKKFAGFSYRECQQRRKSS